jgi:hypothetical protein
MMIKTATVFLLSAVMGHAQTIATRVLFRDQPIKIALSPLITTTLIFPSPLAGTFGLGLVTGAQSGGSIQLEHPAGSNILVFHALTEQAHTFATIVMEGMLYTLELKATAQPDVSVTMVKGGPGGPGAADVKEPVEVTPDQIKEARIKYDPELLYGFLRRAHDAVALKSLYPSLYEKYSVRSANYTSDSGAAKTTVLKIHRFSKEDAIVLEGTVTNETDAPMVFDGRAATVQVANLTEPIKLLDCLRPIPPGATVPIDVVIQGDIDGGRSDLSINNEMRIMLPSEGTIWSLKNGSDVPGHDFNVPKPRPSRPIPLTQTGDPKRDPQP